MTTHRFTGRSGLATLADVVVVLGILAAIWLMVSRTSTAEPAPVATVGSPWPESIMGIDPQAAGHLVYVFRSDCPACAAQKPQWIAGARIADSLGFRVVALTPEPAGDASDHYFDDAPMVSVVADVPPADLTGLGISQVPTTIVVDRSGTIRFMRPGSLIISRQTLTGEG